MFRELFGRSAVFLVVASVYLSPLALVASLGADADLPVIVDDSPDGEPTADVRWAPLPEAAPADDADAPEGVAETPVVLATATPSPRASVAPAVAAPTEAPADPTGKAVAALEGPGPAVAPARPRTGGTSGVRHTSKGRSTSCDVPNPNIHPAADGSVEIDRALVDSYTHNLQSFLKLGSSRPYDENGVEGWYISGFGCASPVAKAGFKRGDVLLAVNGKHTRSWVGVYMLYQNLKNKDDFSVDLIRHGAPVTLHFRVVG